MSLSSLGLTREAVVDHFDKLIMHDPNMTWERYGYKDNGYNGGWDADHIIPKSLYNHENPEDVRRCWSLDNLQPLWHTDNLRKTNKISCSLATSVGRHLWPVGWNGVFPF